MSKWEEAVWLRVEARSAEQAEEQKDVWQNAVLKAPANAPAGRSASPMRLESPIRILIADDSPPLRRQLRRLIECQLSGVVVEEAEDGREAIEKVTQESPDIAIVDIAMPVLNGLLATEKIVAIAPKLPVVVHTLYATPRLEHEARKRGARAVVPKDDVRGLLSVLRQLSEDEIKSSPV